jgi:hypothetical protein
MVEIKRGLEEVMKVAARDAIETCSVIGAMVKRSCDPKDYEY